MRYAVYYTPPDDHPLTLMLERWLGRSAFSGAMTPPMTVDGFSAAEVLFHTESPRRYGAHATLKAPFRLSDNATEAELEAALQGFALRREPVRQKMMVSQLGPFFAIVPDGPSPALNQLADEVVEAFEIFGAPLSAQDVARRNPEKLSARQLEHLRLWGYPYVFEDFRFHITLTGRVHEGEADKMQVVLDRLFNPLLEDVLELGMIGLFVEPEPGAPFHVQSLYALGGDAQKRKLA